MDKKFYKTIQDVQRAADIPEDGSGQRIRDQIRKGKIGKEHIDWERKGEYERAPYRLTEDFFNYLVELYK